MQALKKLVQGGEIRTLLIALCAACALSACGGGGGGGGGGAAAPQMQLQPAAQPAAAPQPLEIQAEVPATAARVVAGVTGGAGNSDWPIPMTFTGLELYKFGGGRFRDPHGVAVGAGNAVYVADTGNHSIRKLSKTDSKVVSTLAGSTDATPGFADGAGSAARFNSPGAVAVDGAGNIWVADTGNHAVRKVTAAGVVSTLARELGQLSGIAVDRYGSVYVTETDKARVLKITSAGTVSVLAGTGAAGYRDGPATSAAFNQPYGLAVDPDRNVYVSEFGNSTIRKISAAGVVSTYSGRPGVSGWADGNNALYAAPAGITLDDSGNVYVADSGNRYVRRISTTGFVTTVGGNLTSPLAVVADTVGVYYVADGASHQVIRIASGVRYVWGGMPAQTGYADGSGSAASFSASQGAATDAQGNVLVADTGNHTIRRVTPDGVVSTIAGSPGRANSTDGVTSAARFNGPRALVADASGNIYVADTGNRLIRKITPDGSVTTLAGNRGAAAAADGTGDAAAFLAPAALALDSSGNLLVGDATLIRKVTPAGVVTTVAGNGAVGSQDGPLSSASFGSISGVALDVSGNVYVTDSAFHTVRLVTAQGVSTVGGVAGQPGSVDGQGSAARFNAPGAILRAADGRIYVADTGNNTIRELSASGAVSTVYGVSGVTGFSPALPGALAAPAGLATAGASLYVLTNNALVAIRR